MSLSVKFFLISSFLVIGRGEDEEKKLMHISLKNSCISSVRWNPANQDEVRRYLLFVFIGIFFLFHPQMHKVLYFYIVKSRHVCDK